MSLFLILSIPITLLVINKFFQNKSVRIKEYFVAILKGAIVAIAALILYFMFDDLIVLKNGIIQIYFYLFFYHDGFIVTILVITWLLYHLISEARLSNKSMLRENAFMIAAFLFVFTFRSLLIQSNSYSLLELFLIPILKLSVILLLSFTLSRVLTNGGSERVLWIVISVLTPFVFNLIPLVYLYNYKLVSVAATIFIFIGSAVLFYLETKGTFAGSPRIIKK